MKKTIELDDLIGPWQRRAGALPPPPAVPVPRRRSHLRRYLLAAGLLLASLAPALAAASKPQPKTAGALGYESACNIIVNTLKASTC